MVVVTFFLFGRLILLCSERAEAKLRDKDWLDLSIQQKRPGTWCAVVFGKMYNLLSKVA